MFGIVSKAISRRVRLLNALNRVMAIARLSVFLTCAILLFSGFLWIKGDGNVKQDITPIEPISQVETDKAAQAKGRVEQSKEHQDKIEIPGTNYHYHQLTPTEKRTYEELYFMASSFMNSIQITPVSAEEYDRAWDAYVHDHPEHYWLFYETIGTLSEDKVYKVKSIVPEDAEEQMTLIDSECDRIMSNAPSGDYEKVKYIYDYLVDNTTYNEEAENNQDLRSVFFNHESVCRGYAAAFKYLCDKAGVECGIVDGDIIGQDKHSWNFVKIGEEYYWVDVTWGDTDSEMHGDMNVEPVNYDYLCCTDDELLADRILSSDPRSSFYDYYEAFHYPECTDDSMNYYKKNGLYEEAYEQEETIDILCRQLNEGAETATISFPSKEQRDRAIWDMFEDKKGWYNMLAHLEANYGIKLSGSAEYGRSDLNNRLLLHVEY